MAKIGILQIDILWENVAGNIEKIRRLLAPTEGQKFDLLVLPELWPCGFTMNQNAHESFAAGFAFMQELARAHRCAVLGGLPKKTADGQENRCYLIDEQRADYYAKIKAFKFAGEHKKYQQGHRIKRFDVAGFKLSPFVCYDLRFPELARSQVPLTNLISYVACWPATRVAHWRTLLQARAVENLSYVVGCNRVGVDGADLHYSGSSMIVAPSGEIVLDCGAEEGLFQAEISVETVAGIRDKFRFLDDINDDWQ